MMVPTLHTKGTGKSQYTTKGRGSTRIGELTNRVRARLVLGLGDELADHGLDNTNVAVEEPADGPPRQRDPDVGGEADHDHAEHGADAAQQQHGLAADAV
jgi:hypothetical protein